MNKSTLKYYQSLGSNEKYMIDKIKNRFMKEMAIRAINFKIKLQFNGWLQYLMPFPLVILLTLMLF